MENNNTVKSNLFNYTFKITNPVTRINLPYTIKNSNSLRVKQCRYITASSNNSYMMIKITGFNNNVYFTGINTEHYTKIILLPPSTLTPVIYEVLTDTPDVLVDKVSSQNGISDLHIELLIDGIYSSDISPNNAVLLEIEIK